MKTASERRFKKEVKRLTTLAEEDINSFLKVWHNRTTGWLNEMHKIAEQVRFKADEQTAQQVDVKNVEKAKGETQTINSTWNRADNLIKACGEKVETLVGFQTRSLLDAECAKLVAQIYEPKTYRMTSPYKRLEDLKATRSRRK